MSVLTFCLVSALVDVSAATVATATPAIRLADVSALKAAIAEQKGKTVVVNFWATWCKPCVKELPELARFYRDYKDKNVAVLGFSADAKSALNEKLPAFAAEHAIPYPIYLIDMGNNPAAVIEAFGDAFGGVLPTTVIYDKTGAVHTSHEGELTYEQLVHLLP